MSRRMSRAAARRVGATSRCPPHAEPDQPAAPHPAVPQANKRFLVVAVLMQAAWIGFLAVMALLS